MPIYKMEGKKDGRQKYRVRVNYTGTDGTPKQAERVAYGFEEAKLLEMQLAQKIKEQPPDSRMTIERLYNEYMAAKKHEVRASTWDKSRRVLELYIIPALGKARLDKFGAAEAQKWKLSMESRATDSGQPLKLRTKQNAYKDLSAMLNYAVKMGHISRNPLPIVGNFKDANSIPPDRNYYTAAEFKAFIKAAKEAGEPHYYVFFNLAFYTGARKGEIAALRWDDIDGEYIKISRSITQKLKGDDVETRPKNKTSIRTIQMPRALITALDEHRAYCEGIEGFNSQMRICGGIKPLRDTSIQNRNKAYSKAAGLKTIRIHDFRHSHASLLANEGINIQEIARRLGHSKVEITWNTYSHLYPREEERAVTVLDEI